MRIGISDITYSERNLKGISIICQNIPLKDSIKLRSLIRKLLESQIMTSSQAVLRRYLNISEKIGVIEKIDSFIRLTGRGQVLRVLSKKNKRIGVGERIALLRSIVYSPAALQLMILLKYIKIYEELTEIIEHYFTDESIRKIWSIRTIRKNLRTFQKHGKLTSFLFNKLGCMLGWLSDLSLVNFQNHKKVRITKAGSTVLEWYENGASIDSFYRTVCNAYQIYIKEEYTWEQRDLLADLLKENFIKFKKRDMAYIDAILIFTCIDLLVNRGVLIEETVLYKVIGKIPYAQVIMSRDGKPKLLSFNFDSQMI